MQPEFPLEKREMSLGTLIDLNVARKQEQIVHVSVTATQENILKLQLADIAEVLRVTEFKIERHREKENKELYKVKEFG